MSLSSSFADIVATEVNSFLNKEGVPAGADGMVCLIYKQLQCPRQS